MTAPRTALGFLITESKRGQSPFLAVFLAVLPRILVTIQLHLACMSLAQAGEMTDPTRPAGAKRQTTARAEVTAPAVTAILIANERRLAVVNGKLVKAGDRLGDLTIEAILDNGVRYSLSGHSAVSELPVIAARIRTSSGAEIRLGDTKQ